MSIEEAIEEINRRSIKLSAVSKAALISSQNFAVASDPGYTVTYTAAPSTHSTQSPVAGSWVKSINLSTLCPEVENIKLGTFLVCLGVYFRLVDNRICSHQHKRSLYNTINTKRRIGVTTLAQRRCLLYSKTEATHAMVIYSFSDMILNFIRCSNIFHS